MGKITDQLIDTGMGAAGNAVSGALGAVMGLALEKHNDKRQINQQKKLQNLQIQGQQQMADYNLQNQLKLWHETNYGAQMKEIQEAGLNPALLYGQGGGGGVSSAASTGNVSGTNAPSGGQEALGLMMENMQLQLVKAQKENIEANTNKTNAEAQNVPKTGANIEASTQNILQDTNNKKAQETGQHIMNAISSIQEEIQGKTKEATIFTIKTTADQALNQLTILKNQAIISENTWNQQIDIINAQLSGILIDNESKRVGIELTQEQIKQVTQAIQTQIKQLQQTDRSLNQKDKDIAIDQARNKLIETGIWVGAATGIAKTVIDIYTGGKSGNKK